MHWDFEPAQHSLKLRYIYSTIFYLCTYGRDVLYYIHACTYYVSMLIFVYLNKIYSILYKYMFFSSVSLYIHFSVGQTALAFFTAHNRLDKSITGVATYNVVPQKAGVYFLKVQCFCFDEQRLRPKVWINFIYYVYVYTYTDMY